MNAMAPCLHTNNLHLYHHPFTLMTITILPLSPLLLPLLLHPHITQPPTQLHTFITHTNTHKFQTFITINFRGLHFLDFLICHLPFLILQGWFLFFYVCFFVFFLKLVVNCCFPCFVFILFSPHYKLR